MTTFTLPKTDLQVSHLCLGGNVFGWSTDEAGGFDVLDAFAQHGGNFIDTADAYSAWVPGHVGGESETIIGNWMEKRGNRSKIVVATKVAKLPTRPGLGKANIIAACEDSLRRLKTDVIDLYYAHEDDETVPLEETLSAFTELRDAGKIRYAAASNYTGARLREAAKISADNNLIEYVALQNHYNLLNRKDYENDSAPSLNELGISGIPFFGLARGFLTGKYREGVTVESVRAGGVAEYANQHGWELLEKLDLVSKNHSTTVSAISLAWLRQQATVSVPIASARTVEQISEIMHEVSLNRDELELLGN
jgi:aryl-alcohol dehydrogenase-like predicted oxidoreductase